MIDLHTHTIFSDGTWTLEEMLTNAEKANISILAITDHDTALPHIKLKDIDIKKFFSGRVIVGGEFNAIFKNTKIELLGYNFNPVQLQNWIDNTYNKKEEIQGYKEEFLEILKENNIKVKGVEINSFEVNILNNKGFDVINTDGISYLMESSENFCGISAIQVVEHMSFDYLYKFVHIAYERLIEGGILILETLDPQNIENLKYFYTDLTHIRPIPNLSLQFLCEKAGFKNIKLCKSLPNKGGYVNYALIAEKSL